MTLGEISLFVGGGSNTLSNYNSGRVIGRFLETKLRESKIRFTH